MQLKPIKLSQEGEQWLAWRDSGIGASESAIIMGALPFKWNDVLELWKKKTKMVEDDFEMNEAMAQGKALEPEAREKYIEVTGISVEAECYEHPEFPFIKASLDGINHENNMVVEIKCPGLGKFMIAKKGELVDYYYSQVQQQIACTDADFAHYWVYRQKEGGVLIKVPRNDVYIKELVRRSTIFWDGVEAKKPVLPRDLGIDMRKDVDPYVAGNMDVELIGHYKN
jgi:putative phage-type endonuclease